MEGGAAMDEERPDFKGVVGWMDPEPVRMPKRVKGLLLDDFSFSAFSPNGLVDFSSEGLASSSDLSASVGWSEPPSFSDERSNSEISRIRDLMTGAYEAMKDAVRSDMSMGASLRYPPR